jgi:hypothetical protein
LLRVYPGLIDLDQSIKGRDSLLCFAHIRKVGKLIMMDIVIIVSALMAAASVGSIALILFLIAIGKIGGQA